MFTSPSIFQQAVDVDDPLTIEVHQIQWGVDGFIERSHLRHLFGKLWNQRISDAVDVLQRLFYYYTLRQHDQLGQDHFIVEARGGDCQHFGR
ncbi:hypothetical protein D3C87_1183420 [compost metagenome]